MKTSPEGVALICKFEGFIPKAYKDVAGIWTIGYGTTHTNGVPVHEGMVCTEDEARQWIADELVDVEHAMNIDFADVDLEQYQFDAVASFAYNVGIGGLRVSTLHRKIKAGQVYSVTSANFTDWNKATINGVLTPVAGLTKRRKIEYQLFNTGTVPEF